MNTLMIWAALALAAPSGEGSPAEAPEAKVEAKDEASVTQGEVRIGRRKIRYEATAGLMVLKDKDGKPKATFGYTAYRQLKSAPARRPIVFAYNGGPGSASIWLHMGVLGPRRVVIDDPKHTGPAPYRYVNNEYSVLDVADLVMMDPVGTGYTKLLGETKGTEYWGVDQDAAAAAEFIARYVTENQRWLSPKYVLGESYGGMRTGAVAYRLMTVHNMDLNGVILVSPFMDAVSGVDGVRNDLAHTVYLPGLAAVAYYHGMLATRKPNLEAFLQEVEIFAETDYLLALRQGNRLDPKDKRAVAKRLARYTGVEPSYWLRANLRVSHGQFLQELQRRKGKTTGRIDGRFSGTSTNLLAEDMDYDPYFSKVRAAYTAAFFDYYNRVLEFGGDRKYKISAGLFASWDWGHTSPESDGFKLPFANTAIDLEYVMKQNPTMRVLVQQGYFDLATPYSATDYFVDHMNISPDERARIEIKYYEAGHMMYVHPGSLPRYAGDLRAFIK